jgi:hypothetical protein
MATVDSSRRDRPRADRGSPVINRVVVWLLGSGLGILLDRSVCVLRYQSSGGRETSFPVRYTRTPGGVLVRAVRARRRLWWHRFRQQAPVEVWFAGRWRPGAAQVVDDASSVVTVRVDVDTRTVPLTGRALPRVWVPVVALAELLGFLAPAVIGALTAAAPSVVIVPALAAAGAVEGAMLGWGQASVLHRALTDFPIRRWIVNTSVGAVVAYLLGMLPALTPTPAVTAAIVGLPLLLTIGVAQWLVLRGRQPWAGRWIAATAGAWLAGLAVFLTVATPLWWEGQPLVATIGVGVGAGVLMATTVALVTGLALRRFLSDTA